MKGLLVLASMTLATTAMAERFNNSNNPTYFNLVANKPMVLKMSELPLKGKLLDNRMAWSDSFWPANKGGIAYRWNQPEAPLFTYKMHSKEEIMSMSEADLEKLSSAELYDISQGDYKYSLTRKVLKSNSPKDLWWEGICHGWSLAASHYPEPDKVVVTNKDGVRVPFGSSDVKGLLSLHDAFNSKGAYTRIGDRCAAYGKVEGEAFPEDGPIGVPSKKAANSSECRDVNAGAFHVVLAGMIGINSQGFVADVDRFNDVWNQPIKAYESEIVESIAVTADDLKSGITKKLRVKTAMTYGDELEFRSEELEKEGVIGFVTKEPVTGTPMQTDTVRNYEYVLEINANGDITGGEWISESRPDMLWMKRRDLEFRNGKFPLAGLNRIYRPIK